MLCDHYYGNVCAEIKLAFVYSLTVAGQGTEESPVAFLSVAPV